MPAGHAVLFDFGAVLVRWDPRTLYRKLFHDAAAMEAFLRDVCPMSWHLRHDQGELMAATVPERIALYPQYEAEIRAWHTRFGEMLDGEITEVVSLIAPLKAHGARIGVLTNMPADKASLCFAGFSAWSLLDCVTVSGFVKAAKPGAEAFRLASEALQVAPAATFFIDDSRANIEAAAALGYQTHHFTDPAALAQALKKVGFLPADGL
jgi:2-haloacid dehalogenase/putative hydrolase of the HAD superfamily